MESMTRMFPVAVIRLREPATATIRTISSGVYGLAENTPPLLLLVLADWNELSILPGFPKSASQALRLQIISVSGEAERLRWL